jgi:hypothetical protein
MTFKQGTHYTHIQVLVYEIHPFLNTLGSLKDLRDMTLTLASIARDIVHARPRKGDLDKPTADGVEIIMNESDELIVCFYCDRKLDETGDFSFYLHPYVSRNYNRNRIIFCEVCIHNYNVFKNNVTRNKGLRRDRNCAICGNLVPGLVFCVTCPRSFCNECLDSLNVRLDMIDTANWKCMACYHRQASGVEDPLKVIETITSFASLGIYHKPSRTDDSCALFKSYVNGHVQCRLHVAEGQTEDLCFVCKDGGELFVCDREGCGKVYHEGCLLKPASMERWECPRHMCIHCGDKALTWACLYCPYSCCGECAPAFLLADDLTDNVMKFISHELDVEVNYIVCRDCSSKARASFEMQELVELTVSKGLVVHSDASSLPIQRNVKPRCSALASIIKPILTQSLLKAKCSDLQHAQKSMWGKSELELLVKALRKYPAFVCGQVPSRRRFKRAQYNLITNDPVFLKIAYFSIESFRKEIVYLNS